MTALHDFFYMNGYGYYVFSAYSLVIIMLAVQWFLPWRRWQRYKRKEQHESNS